MNYILANGRAFATSHLSAMAAAINAESSTAVAMAKNVRKMYKKLVHRAERACPLSVAEGYGDIAHNTSRKCYTF